MTRHCPCPIFARFRGTARPRWKKTLDLQQSFYVFRFCHSKWQFQSHFANLGNIVLPLNRQARHMPVDPSAHTCGRQNCGWNRGLDRDYYDEYYVCRLSHIDLLILCAYRLIKLVSHSICRTPAFFTFRAPWCAWSDSLAPPYDSCAASCDKSLPCDGRRWLGCHEMSVAYSISWRKISGIQAVMWRSKQ